MTAHAACGDDNGPGSVPLAEDRARVVLLLPVLLHRWPGAGAATAGAAAPSATPAATLPGDSCTRALTAGSANGQRDAGRAAATADDDSDYRRFCCRCCSVYEALWADSDQAGRVLHQPPGLNSGRLRGALLLQQQLRWLHLP